MTPLQQFEAKVVEYATNNIKAMMGTIEVTRNEKDDLKLLYGRLEKTDQQTALAFLKEKKIDLGL